MNWSLYDLECWFNTCWSLSSILQIDIRENILCIEHSFLNSLFSSRESVPSMRYCQRMDCRYVSTTHREWPVIPYHDMRKYEDYHTSLVFISLLGFIFRCPGVCTDILTIIKIISHECFRYSFHHRYFSVEIIFLLEWRKDNQFLPLSTLIILLSHVIFILKSLRLSFILINISFWEMIFIDIYAMYIVAYILRDISSRKSDTGLTKWHTLNGCTPWTSEVSKHECSPTIALGTMRMFPVSAECVPHMILW